MTNLDAAKKFYRFYEEFKSGIADGAGKNAPSLGEFKDAADKKMAELNVPDSEISEAMVVNMATRAMLSTECCPKASDNWEDLTGCRNVFD